MRGVVVAPQPRAAEAGAEVLRAGGNAFDAAVTAGFMQAATDPFMSGIGGMGVAQAYSASTGESIIVDFYGRMGSLGRSDMWADIIHETASGRKYLEGFVNDVGYKSILLPGTVMGLGTLHERWGTRPWAELLQPAIEILSDGYPLFAYIADYFHYPFGEYTVSLKERINATPAMAKLWLRDGEFPDVGEHVCLADYASTMERLAREGYRCYYQGELGQQIASDLAAGGALFTAEDLANYQAKLRRPVQIDYRGYTVRSNPAPGGGPTIANILNILEGYSLKEHGHNSPEYVYVLASAMKLAFSERKRTMGDPDFVDVPAERWLDKEFAAAERQRIDAGDLSGPVAELDTGTTHLTVADAEGNVVGITHTLSTGSGVVTPGLGFQYNNAASAFNPEPNQPNSVAPGKARLTSMAPTILFRDGKPMMALGSPGSNAIVNAIVQTIVNVVDFGMAPVEAVSAPRIHCEGGEVMCETRVPAAAVEELQRRGHSVTVRPYGYDTLQGRVQLAYAEQGFEWRGASDPRRDGGSAVFA